MTDLLGEWSALGTTVAEIESAISRLRRTEERGAVRTAVLTLVVLPDASDETAIVLDVIHEMSRRNPAHTIVVVARAGEQRSLDAEVRVHVVDRHDTAVCFEDVLLTVRGSATEHLDSVVGPLTLPDLPVVVWLPDRLPAADDPVLRLADRLVVDSRVASNVGVAPLRALSAISRVLPVTDLSWVRLSPWRELMGGLFEGTEFRPFLRGVQSVRVHGKSGPRYLLAGWLVSRLGLALDAVELVESDHASLEVRAEVDGRRGEFAVRRPTHDREIIASAEIEQGPSHSRVLRLREQSAARVLGRGLARTGNDRVYEEALAAALRLA